MIGKNKKQGALVVGLGHLIRQPLGVLGLLIVVMILGGALLAEYLVLADPIKLSIPEVMPD